MRIRPRALSVLVLLCAATSAVSAAMLIAMRRGAIANDPSRFAVVAGVVLAFALPAFGVAIARRSLPAALFSAGILLTYGGGMANFLFSLQGYTLLTEFDAIRLDRGADLQQFEAGPLSNPAELDLTLQLEKLELVPGAGGTIAPVSHLRLVRRGTPADVVRVSGERGSSSGSLRFSQGAFGFAPRIVVTRDGSAVFDRYVPFVTRRVGADGISFEQTFRIESERLTVRSALDLGSMDDAARGHARLGVAVSQGARELRRGELTMGHFAPLAENLHIGYAGLKRWSEIDISRRNYPQPMLAGALLVLLSIVTWPFARRRE